MGDQQNLKISGNIFDAETQQIDLQWRNLSVYVSEEKREKQRKVQVVDTDTQLLKKYKSSQVQFENENAIELSRKHGKYDYKCILDNQNGFASSGQITAIMGPSGAGKTTMLGCISQRILSTENTIIKGKLTANGSDYDSADFCNFGVFVMQDDLLIATLTVKDQESLTFSANLRLNGISQSEKDSRVEQLIKDLKLGACQHTLVGDIFIKGISGGEKKRTSIGLELIANPPVLVLDEPTSGLDSFTAFVIVDILKKIANKYNRTIVLTIHQPSSDIFSLIDRLILLHDGKTIYQGPAMNMQEYMAVLRIQTPKFSNPCDHFMNQLRMEHSQLSYETYSHYQETDNQSQLDQTNFTNGYLKRDIKNSFLFEFQLLAGRHITNYFRQPQLLRGRIFMTVFFIVFQTCLYWNVGQARAPFDLPRRSPVGDVNAYVMFLSSALFFLGTGSIFSAMGPLIQLFPVDRQIFLKEENSKLYRIHSYFLSKISTEIPFALLTPLFQSTILYYFLGLRKDISSFFIFALISILVSMCGNGLGLFVGCLFNDPKRSAAMAPLILLPLQLFGGQYVNLGSLKAWTSWIQYISPFKYFLEAYCHTQFDGMVFETIKTDGTPFTFYPLIQLNMTFGLWNCIIVLGALALALHILAYIFLRSLTKRITV